MSSIKIDSVQRPVNNSSNRLLLLFLLFCVWPVWSAPDDLSLGNRYYKDEVFRTAADHYRNFLEQNPESDKIPEARLGLARSLVRIGDTEGASKTYQDFLIAHSSHALVAEAGYEWAEVLVQQGNWSKASELFHSYARLKTGDKARRALAQAAEAALQANDLESAKGWCRQYQERYAQGPDALNCLVIQAKVAGREGAWNESVALLRQAMSKPLEPAMAKTVHWGLARGLVQLGDVVKASDHYTKVLALANANDSAALVGEVAQVHYGAKRWKELVAFLGTRSAATLDVALELMLIEAYCELGRPVEALQRMAVPKVLDDNQKVRMAYLKARAYIQSGDRGEGLQVLEELGRNGQPQAWVTAAETYIADRLFQEAIQSLSNAVASYAGDEARTDLVLRIASIYEDSLERPSTARSVFEDFSKNWPGSPRAVEAAMGVARCLEKEHKSEESATAYMRVIEDFPSHPLAQKAKQRHRYLTQFVIRNDQAAIEHLLSVAETVDAEEKTLRLARIFDEDLRQHQKALTLYQRLSDSSINAVTAALATYRAGRLQELAAEKALFENQLRSRQEYLQQARATYSKITQKHATSEWSDDAEWRLLEIGEFSIEGYEAFAGKYPASNVLPDVLYAIGTWYNRKAMQDGPLSGEKAVQAFQRILNSFPESPIRAQAMLEVSRAYIYSGNPQNALPTLQVLVQGAAQEKSVEGEAWLLIGRIAFAERDYAKALKNAKQVLFRYRSTMAAANAQFLLAQSWERLDSLSEAMEQYRLYIDRYPQGEQSWSASLALSMLLERRQALAKATDVITEFIRRDPRSAHLPLAYERIGTLAMRMETRDKALVAFKQAIVVSKGVRTDLFQRIAEIYLALDQFDSSLHYHQKAVKASTTPRDSAHALSGVLASLAMKNSKKEFQTGYAKFKKSFDDYKEPHAKIIYYEGCALTEAGDASKARKRFEYLADKFEETAWAGEGTFYLGSIAFKKGNFKEAIKELEDYVAKNPKGRSRAQALFRLATSYYQVQNAAKAVEYYRLAMEHAETAPAQRFRAAYNAAIAHEKLGQWSNAATLYDWIHANFSGNPEAEGIQVSSGFSWLNAGEPAKAKASFEAALQDTSNTRRKAEAHYWYAKSLDQLSKVDDAVAEYLKVGYLYRDDPMWGLTALFDVGQIYERSGDLERAKRMYERIVEQDGKAGSLGSRAAKYLEGMDKRK